MEKYKTLIKLIRKQDIRDSWINYNSHEEDGIIYEYGDMPLVFIKSDGEVDHVSLNIQNGKVRIDNIVDEYFTSQQADELTSLIKELYEERQSVLKRRAWEKLGILNG